MTDRRACRAARAVLVEVVEAWASDEPGPEVRVAAASSPTSPQPRPGSPRPPRLPCPVDPRVEAALAHARGCLVCQEVFESALLVDRRLRRYARVVGRAPLPDARRPLPRRSAGRRSEGWPSLSALAGLATSAAIVALLVAPGAAWRPRVSAFQEVGVEAARIVARRIEEERREAAVLGAQLRLRSQPPPRSARLDLDRRPDPSSEVDGTPRWAGPDGLGVGPPPGPPAWSAPEPRTS